MDGDLAGQTCLLPACHTLRFALAEPASRQGLQDNLPFIFSLFQGPAGALEEDDS